MKISTNFWEASQYLDVVIGTFNIPTKCQNAFLMNFRLAVFHLYRRVSNIEIFSEFTVHVECIYTYEMNMTLQKFHKNCELEM